MSAVGLPEARLGQHPSYSGLGLFQAVEQRCEEPLQLSGDIQCAFLTGFEDSVVAGAVVEDAR